MGSNYDINYYQDGKNKDYKPSYNSFDIFDLWIAMSLLNLLIKVNNIKINNIINFRSYFWGIF